jgi:NAD(P)H-hydrate repair Nnr-like enzyme with NAD(P)H-hydrate dehydratase domain
VEAILNGPGRAVLDADALTVFESQQDELFKRLRPTTC